LRQPRGNPDGVPMDDDVTYWAKTGTKRHLYRWLKYGTTPGGWCGVVLGEQVRPEEVAADSSRHPVCLKCLRYRQAAATGSR
jgi:hypothetical protein